MPGFSPDEFWSDSDTPSNPSGFSADDFWGDQPQDTRDPSLWDSFTNSDAVTGVRGVVGRGVENIVQGVVGSRLAVGDVGKNLALKRLKNADPDSYEKIKNDPKAMEEYLWSVFGLATPWARVEPHAKARYEQELVRSKNIQAIDYPQSQAAQEAGASDEWYKSPAWWAENSGDVAFQLATMVGANAVAPGLGLAAAGAQSGSLTRNAAVERLRARGYDDPDAELLALGEGTVMGVVEAALEKLPLEMFHGNTELKKSLWEAAGKRLLATGGAAMSEAIEEAGAGVAQDVLQQYIEQDPDLAEKTLGDIVLSEQRLKEAALGAVGGGGLRGGVALAETGVDLVTRKIDQVASNPDGVKKLAELSKKESPSRKDFDQAGLGELKLNAEARAKIAKELEKYREQRQKESEVEQSYQQQQAPPPVPTEAEEQAIEKLRKLDERLGVAQGAEAERAKLHQQIEGYRGRLQEAGYEPDLTGVPPLKVPVPDVLMGAPVERTLPKPVGRRPAKVAPIKVDGQDLVPSSTPTVEPAASDAPIKQVAESIQPPPGVEGITSSLIPEAVEEIIGKPNTGSRGSESDFFHPERGIWTKAVRAAKRTLKTKFGSGLNKPAQKVFQEYLNQDDSKRTQIPFGAGPEFDQHIEPRSIDTAVREAVKDLVPYIQANPGFANYYTDETAKEHSLLVQKYPELADPAMFDMYRLMNAIGSAQTDLFKNTEETDQAYGGYRQTGRVPVVVETDSKGKSRPIYALPKGTDFANILPSEVDSLLSQLATLDNDIPADLAAKLAAKESLSPADLIALKPYATKYKLAMNTSSSDLAAKMWHEWKVAGPEALRNRTRSAFAIAGGSSAYNKARNYAAINALLDRFNGDTAALMDWIKGGVSPKQLGIDKASLGFSDSVGDLAEIKDTVWVAENQSETIPRAFVFGPKVGAYLLNRLGDGRYNTMDVWESRAWRSYFNGLGDDEMGIASGVPRRVYMRAATRFPQIFKEATGLDMDVSAGQAARWFYIIEALKRSGYGDTAAKQTIATYTEELINRWVQHQLGGAHPDMEALHAEFSKQKPGKKPKKVPGADAEAGLVRLGQQTERENVKRLAREQARRGEFGSTETVSPREVVNNEETSVRKPEAGQERTVENQPNETTSALESSEPQGVVSTKPRSVPEEYIRPGGKVVLYRYSRGYRGETYEIDPQKAKPNSYTLNDVKQSGRPRTYFYLNTADKEHLVGNTLYSTEVDSNTIYNLITDHLGIKAKYKTQAGGYHFNDIFDAVQAAGFSGVYYNPGFPVVSMFTAVTGKATVDISRNIDHKNVWSHVTQQMKSGQSPGFTIDPKTGQSVTNGYSVAPSKSSEYIIDLNKTPAYEVPDLLQSYAGRMADVLSQEGYHFGGWVTDGQLYLDVSIVTSSLDKALQIAAENQQLAVFDLNRSETIYLNDVADATFGSLTSLPSDIKKSRPVKSKREIIRNLLSIAGITAVPGDFAGSLKKAAGYYRWINAFQVPGRELAIAKHHLADVGTAVHEVGHFLDDKFGFTSRRASMGRETSAGLLADAVAGDPIGMSALSKMATYDYDKKLNRIAEGFAEVVRLYVTSQHPDQVIDASVLNLFKTVALTNSEVRNVLEEVRSDVLDYGHQDDMQKINHAIYSPGSEVITPNESYFARQDRSFWRALQRSVGKVLADSKRDLVAAEEQMQVWFREHWNSLTPSARRGVSAADAWEKVLQHAGGKASQLMYSLGHAAPSQTQEAMTAGVIHPLTGKVMGQAPAPTQIFEDFSSEEQEEFSQYMVAKVGLARLQAAQAKKKQYTIGEVDPQLLQAMVTRIENGPRFHKYDTAAKQVTAFFNDLIDLQVSEGLLNEHHGQVIKDSHEIYMPFFRQNYHHGSPNPTNIIGVQSSVKKLKQGSVMPVLNVFDAIIDRTQEVYSRVNRHRVETSFVKMAKLSSVGSPFLTRIDSDSTGLRKKDLLALRVNSGELTQEAADILEQDDGVKVDDLLASAQMGRNSNEPIISYRNEYGEVELYRVDPDVYRAATGADNPAFSEFYARVLGVVGAPVALGKFFMVTVNLPYFMAKNVVRDAKTAMIKGLQDVKPEERHGVVLAIPKQIKSGVGQLFNAPSSDVDKLFHRLAGSHSTLLRSSLAINQEGPIKNLQTKSYRRQLFGKSDSPALTQVADNLLRVFNKMEQVNNVFELAPRKAAFLTTLTEIAKHHNGYTITADGQITGEIPQWALARAMNNALEVTVNFGRRGQWAHYLEPYFLFYNSAIQGSVSQILTVKNAKQKWDEGDKRPMYRITANLAASLAAKAMLLYYLMHWKDDEDRPLYEKYVEVSEDMKRDSDVLPVKIPGGGYMTLFLPREREWKVVSNVADLIASAAFNNKKYDSWEDYVNSAVKILTGEVASRVPVSGGPLSTAMQIYTGQDFFRGRPIENSQDQRRLVQYRADERTSAPAKWLSEHGGATFGFSPKELDFISRNTIGSMPFNLADWAQTGKLSKAPILGAFLTDGIPRESVNDLYTASERNIQKLQAHMFGQVQYSDNELRDMRDREISLGIAQNIMSSIRESNMSPEMQARYMTGIARWALDREPLGEYPNPLLQLSNEDLPLAVRQAAVKSIQSVGRPPGKQDIDTERGIARFKEQMQAKARVGTKLRSILDREPGDAFKNN